MHILIYLLIAAGITALVAGYFHNKSVQKKIDKGELPPDALNIVDVQKMECCGQHETCEKDSLLAAISKEIEYYNDEELDEYRGIPSDQYTAEQIEEFRNVLFTMREDEVAGWVRSLQLRAVELPDELKDEVFLIIGERRNH